MLRIVAKIAMLPLFLLLRVNFHSTKATKVRMTTAEITEASTGITIFRRFLHEPPSSALLSKLETSKAEYHMTGSRFRVVGEEDIKTKNLKL